MARRLRALLVGIDAYPSPIPPLAGCVNDVTAFAEVLRGRLGEGDLALELLTNGAATRAAVTQAIRGHLGRAGAHDVALLYYSGHGSQQRAPAELWPLEPDRRNETIVLVDSRRPGQWDLADKELAVLLADVATGGCHVVTVLDCCHSGGGTRTTDPGARLRLAPEDDRVRPFDTFLPGAAETGGVTRGVRSRWSTGVGSQVLIAACRSSEKAKEVTVRGTGRGALSVALEEALRESGGALTYRQLHRHVLAAVLRRVEDQHPQLEASDATDLESPFLGGALPATPPQLTLSRLPEGWAIDSGAVHGVPEPLGADSTELAVYALVGETTGSPLATGRVTKVLADRSIVRLSATLDESLVYRAVITSIPLRPLEVGVVGDGAGAASLREAAVEADSTLIELVPDATDADLVVEATAEGFAITRPGVTRPLVPVVGGERREQRTVAALEHVARWMRLAALHNPSTRLPEGALAVGLRTPAGTTDADGQLAIAYAAGSPPTFTVTISNTTDSTLWCALLDLTETYGIFTDAFPAGSVALGPGESTEVALTGQVSEELWQAGTVTVTDHLKVVTSTLEFDPRSLEQDELDVSVAGSMPVPRGAAHPRSSLERLLARVITRRLEPASVGEPMADWRTDDLFVRTTRPRP